MILSDFLKNKLVVIFYQYRVFAKRSNTIYDPSGALKKKAQRQA